MFVTSGIRFRSYSSSVVVVSDADGVEQEGNLPSPPVSAAALCREAFVSTFRADIDPR